MAAEIRVDTITSRTGINTLSFTGSGLSFTYNVGFGTTTNPRAKVDVEGDAFFNGGKVGIGTTLPTSKLDVVGDVQIAGVITATQFKGDGSTLTGVAATSNIRTNAIVNSGVTTVSLGSASIPTISPSGGSSTGIFFPTTGSIGFATSGVEAVRIDSSGKVHIGGSNSALSNLNISGTGGQGGGIQINRNSTGNPTTGQSLGSIAFKGVASANTNVAAEVLIESIAVENHTGITAASDLVFYTKSSGTGPGSSPTERVRVSSAGSFAIGTQNPGSLLDISGGQFRIRSSGTFSDPTDNAGVIAYDSVGGDFTISARSSGGSTALTFRTSNSGSGAERLRISSTGNITPGTTNSQDLGSNTLRWANIFTNDLQLSNEGSQNDIDGTWGNYTIQEGENDLFLINRRNGKKYKFVLQEVN